MTISKNLYNATALINLTLNKSIPSPDYLMKINVESYNSKTSIAIFSFNSLDSKIVISNLIFNWEITNFTQNQYLNGLTSSFLKVNLSEVITSNITINLNVTMLGINYVLSQNYLIPIPPTQGNCVVNPFTGFNSSNTPLVYKYDYINKINNTVPFSGDYMLSQTFKSSLVPLSQTFIAEAMDSTGLTTTTLCPVIVNKFSTTSIVGDQIEQTLNSIGDLTQKLTVSLYNNKGIVSDDKWNK